jgi:hypothetical protein
MTQADRAILEQELDRLRLAAGTSDLDALRVVWREVRAFVNDVLEQPVARP